MDAPRTISFMQRAKTSGKKNKLLNWLRELFEVFRTASTEANALAISATFLLLIKILLLNKIPAIFSGAYEIGLWVDSILASIIASYAFYIVVVHIKERSDKMLVQPYIQKHAGAIVSACTAQITAFSDAASVHMSFNQITEAQVEEAFKKLKPYGPSRLIAEVRMPPVYAPWIESMIYYKREAHARIAKIIAQPVGLDAQTVEILTRVEGCEHFEALSIFESVTMGAEDLTNFSGRFYRYCLLCRELDNYLRGSKNHPENV
ncbi:hypothetical protein CWC49_06245 [Pseudomonas sp. S09F 262]|nr:hypothetical protein CWC49_06245 [Pseudomonas sp. S09F 262]